MAQDVSGVGVQITLVASKTFPIGLPVQQFAADTDPIDMASVDIADTQMSLNGDLIAWAKATKLPFAVAVIPGSPTDINLQLLADANRVAPGKIPAGDVIDLTIIYPDGSPTVFVNGRLTAAMFGKSIASSGMIKTRVYGFSFEDKSGA